MTPGRGGDGGGEATTAATGCADLEGSRSTVEPDRDPPSDRRVSADGWPSVDAATPNSRRCALRAAHGLSVEGRTARVWNGFHAAPAVSPRGRGGDLGEVLGPAAPTLQSGRPARLAAAVPAGDTSP